MNSPYSKFIASDRRRPSAIKGRSILEETSSDRSRVIFSSPIRRLQQKAQVFSLEPNASVRTRLTHTLEVSDNGRWIATKVAEGLHQKNLLPEQLKLPFINLVETSCFLHDIGNPPFGHFGEAAIQGWFKRNQSILFQKSFGSDLKSRPSLLKYLEDFSEFDGNPQGFRIITLLTEPPGSSTGTGMNLTLSQLFCFLKYLREPAGEKGPGIMKKAGYFYTEKEIADQLKSRFDHSTRFPLTYIMEAADDISYCLSDIEDGVEKKIINIPELFDNLLQELAHDVPFGLEKFFIEKSINAFFGFKATIAKNLIEQAANTYLTHHDEILKGTRGQLFEKGTESDKILSALKVVSSKLLFRSREAEDMEIAGFTIISGLLDKFQLLLALSHEDFGKLLLAIDKPNITKEEKLEVEWRYFNILPRKYVNAYKFQLDSLKVDLDNVEKEWYLRCHLIVDFISGMTDGYAYEVYKLFHGIETR